MFLVAATQQGRHASRVCLNGAPATGKRKTDIMVGTSFKLSSDTRPTKLRPVLRQDPDRRCKHRAADLRCSTSAAHPDTPYVRNVRPRLASQAIYWLSLPPWEKTQLFSLKCRVHKVDIIGSYILYSSRGRDYQLS